MNCVDAFPKELKKRINKTREARTGKGVYKRRNKRDYRVIMHLNTYKKIKENNDEIFNKYKNGYVVRVKPDEYFTDNGEIKSSFPETLELGKNAFLYFKTIEHWDKYKSYCSNFDEVYELYERSETVDNDDQWTGKICKYISNKRPQIKSLICHSGRMNEEQILEYNELKRTYPEIENLPNQTGLGNFDYDYASADEIENVRYQLSMMIFRVPGMKNELKLRTPNLTDRKINNVGEHIISFCNEKNLYNLEKLTKIRALDEEGIPICPLCLEKLNAESFFKIIDQDEGREEEDNTKSEIVLMHINPLTPGKFNHSVYNLGWGHNDCNTIQGEKSIDKTLIKLNKIVENNKSES